MAAVKTIKTKDIREYGDFQTPIGLARDVIELLIRLGVSPNAILEPTCGKGAFVITAAAAFQAVQHVVGYEINNNYIDQARTLVEPHGDRAKIHQGDFFLVDWAEVMRSQKGPWLIVGNPPWVTNSELGSIESANVPEKSNFQSHKGLDAITGKANFDISEHMLLKYLEWLNGEGGTIAVLCKTAVARKILLNCWKKQKSQIIKAQIYKIDALSHFGAAVDACLFIMQISPEGEANSCAVFDNIHAHEPITIFGYASGHVIPDINEFNKYKKLLGPERKYTWRSGIKHDCAKVMDLRITVDGLVNGLASHVEIERDFLYPMLKSSDVGNGRTLARAMMLVPQKAVGDRTEIIKTIAPQTWDYLVENEALMAKRGSSIYKNKPRFSIFGIGEYTFAPWKVAISGFYKRLRFLKVGPDNGKPVVFDDTIYFLACKSEDEADFLLTLLTSQEANGFYNSMIHWDEKRPITVDILKRLDLRALSIILGHQSDYDHFTQSNAPMLFDDLPMQSVALYQTARG